MLLRLRHTLTLIENTFRGIRRILNKRNIALQIIRSKSGDPLSQINIATHRLLYPKAYEAQP